MKEPLTGRELDLAVAALMGDTEEEDGVIWWQSQDGSRISTEDDGPRYYSTQIGPAWKVVEHFRAQGWIVRVQEMPDGLPFLAGSGWRGEEGQRISYRVACTLSTNPIRNARHRQCLPGVTAFGDTAAEAICRAALEAPPDD